MGSWRKIERFTHAGRGTLVQCVYGGGCAFDNNKTLFTFGRDHEPGNGIELADPDGFPLGRKSYLRITVTIDDNGLLPNGQGADNHAHRPEGGPGAALADDERQRGARDSAASSSLHGVVDRGVGDGVDPAEHVDGGEVPTFSTRNARMSAPIAVRCRRRRRSRCRRG